MKIYNSLTQDKVEFQPNETGNIKLYVCGVTVYDYCHLGHARTYVAFDAMIRYWRFRGYDVMYVRNITDIDDKIIQRAALNKENPTHLAERFTKAMHDDFAALGILPPDHSPRATHYISEMIALIEVLIAKGAAYRAGNHDVYFSVRAFATYGCLSHRHIDQLTAGARVDVNEQKRDPLDFVLWKSAKPGEPAWDSPWGLGRPGWHIECSAMSMKLLGESFDIHGGGRDLIFPHHENEVAQSECASGKPFASIWMHTGYLQMESEKMSKSLGNVLLIRDVLKNHPAEVIRYFLLANHYRSPLQYSEANLSNAQAALERFYLALRGLPNTEALFNTDYERRFIEAMEDDFNIPVALSVLFDLSHAIQKMRQEDLHHAAMLGSLLKRLGAVLGLLSHDPDDFLRHSDKLSVDVSWIEEQIVARNAARAGKQWADADRIRDELLKHSIVLEDGVDGTTWRVVKS